MLGIVMSRLAGEMQTSIWAARVQYTGEGLGWDNSPVIRR